jgi:uncharacterized membrane protein SpoIIM required for sporulation
MISTHWLEKRKPHWEALDRLVQRCGKRGVSALNRSELRDLSLLYRQAAADLSAVREDPAARTWERYLNQLLGRAHNIIYAGTGTSAFGLVRFYRDVFPAIFRRNLRYTIAATAIFLAGAAAGAFLTIYDPGFQLQVLGPEMVRTIERREMWTHSIVTMKPAASSFIMTNNISVSFMAFASGVLAGLGPIYMMVMNGLLMGVISAACGLAGMGGKLWAFVALHGSLELPAVMIAGGAGLRLGHGLLFPGWLSRKQSLAAAGADAVQLVAGVVPILVIAGLIEGFLSPTDMPAILRFPLAAMLFALLVAYLMGATERRSQS